MASRRDGLDAYDACMVSVSISEYGDVVLGNGWMLGEWVLYAVCVVLVLLNGKVHVDEEVVDGLHECDEVRVANIEPLSHVIHFTV